MTRLEAAFRDLKAHDKRRKQAFDNRTYWEPIWKDLANYILPQYGRFLFPSRGTKVRRGDENMVTSWPTLAARTTTAGLQGGMTSPVRPWFRFDLEDPDKSKFRKFREWLDMVTDVMTSVMSQSNFYEGTGAVWAQGPTYGTGVTVIEPDFNEIIRATTLRIGEYALASDSSGRANALYRDFYMTVAQMADKFGKEKLSRRTRALYDSNQGAQTVRVVHVIEPNDGRVVTSQTDRNKPWLDLYYEYGMFDEPDAQPLRVAGYDEQPFAAFRWEVGARDDYGFGPGWIVLPDVKELHAMKRDLGVGIEKSVDPPMQAHISDEGRVVNAAPGGLSYYSNLQNTSGKISPLYEVAPDLSGIAASIEELKNLIDQAYYKDLFLALMVRSGGSAEKTAREIVAIEQEKLLMLSPVLERANNEYLNIMMKRALNIMLRGRLIPPPPVEMSDEPVKVEYISILAQAQKMLETSKIEQGAAFVAQLSTLWPEAADSIDPDFVTERYLSALQVPTKMLRDPKVRDQIRYERAMREQMAEQMAMMGEAAKQGKTLSEISGGSSQNALQALLGGLGGAGV